MQNQNEELKKAGLKATLPRIKIMEVLASTALQEEAHFSAEDIYKELILNNEDIGLATVYRVLTQFEAAGMVKKHHFEGSHAVYEVIEEQLFDAILSNPPYIDPSDRALDPSTDCEPRKALIAEDDGLADLKHIIKEGIDFLKPEGIMLLEHGYQQAKALSAYAKSLGLTAIETLQDLNGHDRLIMLQR